MAPVCGGYSELPTGADDGERLLLAVEELAPNGLRHGRPPVRITITAAGLGWLLEVSDSAPDRPPTPAVGRDAALGGMGLHMVAPISDAHGWAAAGDRKIVWIHILYDARIDPPSPQRVRAATACTRGLAACLAVSEARIAATLPRLAVDTTARGRPDRAPAHRAVAERAWREAERARRISLTTPPPPRLGIRRLG